MQTAIEKLELFFTIHQILVFQISISLEHSNVQSVRKGLVMKTR